MKAFSSIRLCAGAMLATLSLALSGCFIAPGKFQSELALTGGDRFTFSYDGEIFFAGLSKLAQMGAAKDDDFAAECRDAETFDERPCTAAETAEQRAQWDASAAERAAERQAQAQQMAAIMGGIDPSDPKAADDLAALLLRQNGWEEVQNLGDGLFKVRYRISGTLGHDFVFPLIEGFPATNPFVQTFARKNGQLRINAPGFAAQGSDGPMSMMMGGLGPLAALGGGMSKEAAPGSPMPNLPAPEGTFTIRTAGTMAIRANNTDEGPVSEASGEVLTWQISPRTAQIPTALIDLTS